MFPLTTKLSKKPLIGFRLRTKWQICRGYVPSYERTPKIKWFDIHSVFATHVETVVLLTNSNDTKFVNFHLSLDSTDITASESKVSSVELQDYILQTYGLKVSRLYISQVKRANGLEVKESHNRNEESRHPNCPPEKWKAIEESLKHFKML